MVVETQCPFCFEFFGITVHPEDGAEQNFVYDCEVCCRPIDVVAICFNDGSDYRCTIESNKSSGMD